MCELYSSSFGSTAGFSTLLTAGCCGFTVPVHSAALDKVYFVVSTDGGYKVCPVTYSASEHKYTLESNGSIDYNPGSVYDFPECEQKHINKNGYFFWNYDLKKFIFIDGSDGTRRELGTNLPDNGNLTIVDFAVTDTEIYFTASREGESLYTPTLAGKVNISTGDYTDTNLSISVNAMTVVDF